MKKQLLLAILMLLPFVVNASGINPNLGFSTNEHWDANRGFVATLGQPFNSPKLNNSYNVSPIEWTSSDPEIATVDGNGLVTLVGVGETQIIATFAGNDEYLDDKAEYHLLVMGTKYKKTGEGTAAVSYSNQPGKVTIKKNAWIGMNVTICPGVTIGEYAVVGAGAVVTKDIPSNVTAFGNPCKVYKINEETIIISNFNVAAFCGKCLWH